LGQAIGEVNTGINLVVTIREDNNSCMEDSTYVRNNVASDAFSEVDTWVFTELNG